MNKKILLIILLAVFITAVLYAEGLNSTSINEKIAKDIFLKEGYLETIPECPEYDHSGLMPLISKKKIGFYYKNLGDLTKNGFISCGTYGSGSSSDKDNWKYHGIISGFCRKQVYTEH